MKFDLKEVLFSQPNGIELLNKIEKIRETVDDIISKSVPPKFTSHDRYHSERILENLAIIIPEELVFKLNQYELYFLICAVYLHDIGLNIYEETDNLGEDIDKNKTYIENIRKNHHIISENIIFSRFREFYIPNIFQAKIMGRIARGHTNENLNDIKIYNPTHVYLEYYINIPLLAAFLRLADNLHIGSGRVPEIQIFKYLSKDDLANSYEWLNYFEFIEIGISIEPYNTRIIELIVVSESPKIHKMLRTWELDINKEIQELPSYLNHYREYGKNLPRGIHIIIEPKTYDFNEFLFLEDIKKVLPLKETVFISGTSDVSRLIEKLYLDLKKLGFEPYWYKSKFSQSRDTIDIVLNSVEQVDKFILIINKRYGLISKKSKESLIEQELKIALKQNIPTLIFIPNKIYHQFGLYKDLEVEDPTADYLNDQGFEAGKNLYEFINRILKNQKVPWIETYESFDDIVKKIKVKWKIEPNTVEFIEEWKGIGDKYFGKGDYKQAIDSYKKILEFDPNIDTWLNVGIALSMTASFNEAIDIFQKVLKLDPYNLKASVNLGYVYFKVGLFDEALKVYENVLNSYKSLDHASAGSVSRVYNNLGNVYYSLNRHKEAKNNYFRALKTDPNYGSALLNIGKLFSEEKNYQRAIEIYHRYIELNPIDTNVLNNLGIMYYQLRQYNKAITTFKKALAIDPKLKISMINLIKSFRIIGRDDDAERYTEQYKAESGDEDVDVIEGYSVIEESDSMVQSAIKPPFYIEYIDDNSDQNDSEITRKEKNSVKIVLVQSSYHWDYLFIKSTTSPDYHGHSFTILNIKPDHIEKIKEYYRSVIRLAIQREADYICFPEFIYLDDPQLKEELNQFKEQINIITGTYISVYSYNTCEMYIKGHDQAIIQHKLNPYYAIRELFRTAPYRVLKCVRSSNLNIVVCICIDIASRDIIKAIQDKMYTENPIHIVFSPSYNTNAGIHNDIRETSQRLNNCIIFANDATTKVSSKVFLKGKEVLLEILDDHRPDLYYFELDLDELRD